MKTNKLIIFISLIGLLLFSSCEDFLTTNPSVDFDDDKTLTNLTGLEILLNGTYRKMKDGNGDLHATSPIGLKSYSTGVASIDISSNVTDAAGNEIGSAYKFDVSSYMSDGRFPRTFFQNYYEIINNTNLLITNAHNAGAKEGEIKGQALIMRARCYYNLVRLYQHTYILAKDKLGVPLQLEPSSSSSEKQGRATVAQVYEQIEKDLLEAIELYPVSSSDMTKYDVDVAYFLLADMYLTKNEWKKASDAAEKITSVFPLMTNTQYRAGFYDKNDEWILGYEQTDDDSWYYNSIGCVWYWEGGTQWAAKMFYPTKEFVENVITESDARYTFRINPIKKNLYISDKFNDRPKGGQPILSDMCDLRAAEMYLVEAEAKAQLGETSKALKILNDLQTLRNAPITKAEDNLLEAIYLERRKELYGEGIDLWDAKRLQRGIVRVKDDENGGHDYSVNVPANSNKLVLQIPRYEMTNNDKMVQNPDPSKEPVFTP